VADADDLPDRLLASALEFAVGIAATNARSRPRPLPFPAAMRPFLRERKLSHKALAEVRRAVEDDEGFRRALGTIATDDLVDEAGLLWLRRPDGWGERLVALARERSETGPAGDLRRAERRREAAEQASRRATAELAGARAEAVRQGEAADEARRELAAEREVTAGLRASLAATEDELRRARQRLAAAVERTERARADAVAATERAEAAEAVRDHVLAQRAGADATGATEALLAGAARLAEEVAEHALGARRLAAELARLAEEVAALEPVRAVRSTSRARPARGRPVARRPLALPGGVYGSSREAAEHLVRAPGVAVLVDGYNVAKTGWPALTLEEQRGRCIDAAEDVARRYGTDVAVVFDGAAVAGTAAGRRRLVRIRFSPEGVSADDVLRDEVAGAPSERSVIVVTNDQAIVSDVRSFGANTMTSEQFLDLARR